MLNTFLEMFSANLHTLLFVATRDDISTNCVHILKNLSFKWRANLFSKILLGGIFFLIINWNNSISYLFWISSKILHRCGLFNCVGHFDNFSFHWRDNVCPIGMGGHQLNRSITVLYRKLYDSGCSGWWIRTVL